MYILHDFSWFTAKKILIPGRNWSRGVRVIGCKQVVVHQCLYLSAFLCRVCHRNVVAFVVIIVVDIIIIIIIIVVSCLPVGGYSPLLFFKEKKLADVRWETVFVCGSVRDFIFLVFRRWNLRFLFQRFFQRQSMPFPGELVCSSDEFFVGEFGSERCTLMRREFSSDALRPLWEFWVWVSFCSLVESESDPQSPPWVSRFRAFPECYF